MRHRLLTLLIILLSPSAAFSQGQTCPEGEVGVFAPDGSLRSLYQVSVADEPSERERGLMFVQRLPADEGMLFVFETAGEVGFWMRNTLIPLDMIFIDQTGRVVRVHHGAIPHDETPIWSGAPVTGVLEVIGGEAGRAGVEAGDLIRSPFFEGGCDVPFRLSVDE